MIKNIIFDYNGVISNDFELVYKTSNKLFEFYQLPQMTFEDFREKYEIPAYKFWNKIAPTIKFDEINKRYFEIYKDMGKPSIYLYVKDTLHTLAENKNLVILSSHKKENILEELNSFGINPSLFSAIYADVKDKLDVIEQIVKKQNLVVNETAYVGDTEHDIETAKKAGIVSIASTYGYRTREQLEKVKPDLFIEDFSEVLKRD